MSESGDLQRVAEFAEVATTSRRQVGGCLRTQTPCSRLSTAFRHRIIAALVLSPPHLAFVPLSHSLLVIFKLLLGTFSEVERGCSHSRRNGAAANCLTLTASTDLAC
eukprot:2807668-Pleurochrysis_carterae.AAC.2